MSALAKGIFLTFALFASFVCALWIVVTVYVLFNYHGIQPRVGFMLPIIGLGGAAWVGFKFYYDERRGSPTFSTEGDSDTVQHGDGRLLTTRLGTGIAVGLTALVFILAIRDALHPSLTHGSLVPFSFMLHGTALIAANVAFWGYVAWLAFCFIRGTRGRERVVMIGWAVSLLLIPVEKVWPEWVRPMRYTDVLALLIALLAAVSLLLRPIPSAQSADSE